MTLTPYSWYSAHCTFGTEIAQGVRCFFSEVQEKNVSMPDPITPTKYSGILWNMLGISFKEKNVMFYTFHYAKWSRLAYRPFQDGRLYVENASQSLCWYHSLNWTQVAWVAESAEQEWLLFRPYNLPSLWDSYCRGKKNPCKVYRKLFESQLSVSELLEEVNTTCTGKLYILEKSTPCMLLDSDE